MLDLAFVLVLYTMFCKITADIIGFFQSVSTRSGVHFNPKTSQVIYNNSENSKGFNDGQSGDESSQMRRTLNDLKNRIKSTEDEISHLKERAVGMDEALDNVLKCCRKVDSIEANFKHLENDVIVSRKASKSLSDRLQEVENENKSLRKVLTKKTESLYAALKELAADQQK